MWINLTGFGLKGILFAVSVAGSSALEMTVKEDELKGKRIAILVSDGFEQSEMVDPRKALDAAGAKTVLISLKPGQVRAWSHTEWGDQFPVDLVLSNAKVEDFDALVLPGGVMNPDKLRMDNVMFHPKWHRW